MQTVHACYIHSSTYTYIQGDKIPYMAEPERHFSEFMLVVESEGDSAGRRVTSTAGEGSYQLLGDVLTRFSDHCTNTVVHTQAEVNKTEIQVQLASVLLGKS